MVSSLNVDRHGLIMLDYKEMTDSKVHGKAQAVNSKKHCFSSDVNFEISVGHLVTKPSPGFYATSPLVMINEFNLVSSSPIGSIIWTPFVWTMKGSHISESITVQYTFPYSYGFHVKNGSVQLKSKAPVIEMVSST